MDRLYASSNGFGIPDLLRAKLAGGVDFPVDGWGSFARSRRGHGGTIHHYVDDYRFTGHWEQAGEKLIEMQPGAVCECNFSLFPDTPAAVAAYQIYRKRWLSRHWQEAGIRVFVDLNVAEEHASLNLVGVPRGYPYYSTRAYARDLAGLEREYATAWEHAMPVEPVILVIGGGKAAREFMANRPGIIWARGGEPRSDGKMQLLEANVEKPTPAVPPEVATTLMQASWEDWLQEEPLV